MKRLICLICIGVLVACGGDGDSGGAGNPPPEGGDTAGVEAKAARRVDPIRIEAFGSSGDTPCWLGRSKRFTGDRICTRGTRASQNSAPTASDLSVTVDYGSQTSDALTAADADNDPLTFEVVDMPILGTLTVNSTTGEFTYSPPPLQAGTDSFTYRVSDGQLTSNVATVTITVNPAYDICEECAPDFETPGLMERSASILDLNQDGLDDLIFSGPAWIRDPNTGTFVTDIRTPVRVLLNDGSGNFVDGTAQVIAGPIPALVHAAAGTFADFNGDGLPDVFLGDTGPDADFNIGEPNVLLLSTATGQLADASDNLVGQPCVSAVPAYVGAPDCATVNFELVYEGNGPLSPVPVDAPHSAASGDIDGDGDNDIFVQNVGFTGIQTNLYFLLNDGFGNFTANWAFVPIEIRMFGGGGNWATSELFDLDGDTRSDLVVGAQGPSFVPGRFGRNMIFWNDGTGDFSRGSLCNRDGDGGCALGGSAAEVTVLPTVEDRTYPTQVRGDPDIERFYIGSAITAADIDGDQDLDLIIANTGAPPGSGWAGRFIQVFINNGDRTFTDESAARFPVQTGDGRWLMGLEVIDFNGDGAPDLLAQHDDLSEEGFGDLIWINDGAGRFAVLDNSVLGKTGWLFPVDVHGDGDLDFLVYNDIRAIEPDHVQDFSLLIRRSVQ